MKYSKGDMIICIANSIIYVVKDFQLSGFLSPVDRYVLTCKKTNATYIKSASIVEDQALYNIWQQVLQPPKAPKITSAYIPKYKSSLGPQAPQYVPKYKVGDLIKCKQWGAVIEILQFLPNGANGNNRPLYKTKELKSGVTSYDDAVIIDNSLYYEREPRLVSAQHIQTINRVSRNCNSFTQNMTVLTSLDGHQAAPPQQAQVNEETCTCDNQRPTTINIFHEIIHVCKSCKKVIS